MSRLEPPLAFVCVGVPKAGTTSLHYALKKHPGIHMPLGKEVEIRGAGDRRTPETWHEILKLRYALDPADPPDPRPLGLVNPRFWMDPSFAAYLRRSFPEVRILVVLRDPADRLISHYLEHLQRGEYRKDFRSFVEEGFDPERLARVFDPSLRIGPHNVFQHLPSLLVRSSLYARVLKEYLEQFPRSRIHVMIFERLVQRPEEVMRELFRFLGVEPLSLPLARRHARDVTRRRPWVRPLADAAVGIGIRLQRFWLPRKMVKVLLGRRVFDVWYWLEEHRRRPVEPDLSPEAMRRLLIPRLKEDVRALFDRIGPVPEWEAFDEE